MFAKSVESLGYSIENKFFFDTLTINVPYGSKDLMEAAEAAGINLRRVSDTQVGVSMDETVTREDLLQLVRVFATGSFDHSYKHGVKRSQFIDIPDIDAIATKLGLSDNTVTTTSVIPAQLHRKSSYLTHPIFNSYRSETDMLRYIVELQNKDLSLANAMIPLGSCTMKLNATSEMIPVTWPEFGKIHPFAPLDQAKGYATMFKVCRERWRREGRGQSTYF